MEIMPVMPSSSKCLTHYKPTWLGIKWLFENAKPRGVGSHEVSSTSFLVFPRNKVKLTGSDLLYKLI